MSRIISGLSRSGTDAGRPEPAVTLDQRQDGAETIVENRHAFADSAWQGALPAPLWDLNSMGMMIPCQRRSKIGPKGGVKLVHFL